MLRAALILALLLLPASAQAHAQLRASDPPAGAVMAEAPGEVALSFNEPVAPLALRWIGPDGTMTDLAGRAENTRLVVRPPEGLGRGTHLLSWRVVSADGHPVGGTLAFSIGAPTAAPVPPGGGSALAWWAAAGRLLLTLTLVAAVGTAVFAALVAPGGPPAVRRLGLAAAALTAPAAAGALAAQGLDLTAGTLPVLLSAAPWQAALAAPLARAAALAVLAAGLASASLALPAGRRRLAGAAAVAAWALAALSFAATGHAATAEPRALAVPAVVLHAAALLFWMGSLPPLLLSLRRPGAAAVLARFSSLALPLVLLLVGSGALLVALQACSLDALLGSSYGALLAAKLTAVAAMLALALANRLALAPRLAAGAPGAGRALSRTVRAEILLGALAIALATGFRLTPPPRALAEAAAPLQVHMHEAQAMAELLVAPRRTGTVEATAVFRAADGAPLVPREASIAFGMPAGGIEPVEAAMHPRGDGTWQAGPLTLPVPGEWAVTIRLLITDFEQATLRGTVTLGR